jgi:hypothetical protein
VRGSRWGSTIPETFNTAIGASLRATGGCGS